MPINFIAIALIAFVIATPIAFAEIPTYVEPMASPQIINHYTRKGVVLLNTANGATRFVPYRHFTEIDRRANNRAEN